MASSAVRSGFWDGPLGYAQAWVVAFASLVVGLGFHFAIGYDSPAGMGAVLWMAWALLASMLVIGRAMRTSQVVQWITGIPFAVASTSLVGAIALVGGVVPQSVVQGWGAPSVWSAWPFLMALFPMLANLLGSIGKRSWPLNYSNVLYILSHAGLAVAIVGGAVSGATLERKTMTLFEGQPSQLAEDAQHRQTKMPFTLTLREFRMDTFPPTLAIARRDASAPDGAHVVNGSSFLKAGALERIDGYKVEVLEFLPKAASVGSRWISVPWKTASPAARVRATAPDGERFEGWVSCGGVESSGAALELGPDVALAMPRPRPRKFQSSVDVDHGGTRRSVVVEVNGKATVGGYDLYQLDYDVAMGAASPYSVIEVVRDRGLPVVYLGMAMMLAGATLHLWHGIGGRK